MNHCDIQINFDEVELINEVVFDETYASDPTKIEELKKFAKAFYKQNCQIFHETYPQFLNMRLVAIKSNNLLALEVLWQVVTYPSYENSLEDATEFGNLKTFQHCLHTFMNYAVNDGHDDIPYEELKVLASKNSDPNVLQYLVSLEPCMIEGKLKPEFSDDVEILLDYWNDYPELHLEEKWKFEERQRKEENIK